MSNVSVLSLPQTTKLYDCRSRARKRAARVTVSLDYFAVRRRRRELRSYDLCKGIDRHRHQRWSTLITLLSLKTGPALAARRVVVGVTRSGHRARARARVIITRGRRIDPVCAQFYNLA